MTQAGLSAGRVLERTRVCSIPIGRTQIEYELLGTDGRIYVHLTCFTVWNSEAAVRRLAARANDGEAAN